MLGEHGYQVQVILLKGFFIDRFQDLKNLTAYEVTIRGGDLNLAVIYHYYRLLKTFKPLNMCRF